MPPLRDFAHRDTPFALLHRASSPDVVEAYTGQLRTVPSLAELPLPPLALSPLASSGSTTSRDDLLVVVPYRQLRERGFPCVDDGAPLLALTIATHDRVALADALATLPQDPLELTDAGFDLSDDAYADIVRQVLTDEIGRGEGSNFVIRRTFTADLGPVSARTGLAIFQRLLRRERGAYWTFVVHGGGRTLVGATPERHVSLSGGMATMTPISGTYRYPAGGPTMDGLLAFLADHKEIDELSMVVDEELKMLTAVCRGGVRVTGPRLREMARLAHTEYTVTGRCDADVRAVLSASMFAPTVVGSPLRSASRVVAAYEHSGRGYYGGVLALIGRADGGRTLDSAICIRTAEIDAAGRLAIDVGATIVRGSDPRSEAAETTAKAAGLLAAITDEAAPWPTDRAGKPTLGDDPRVGAALTARTRRLAPFWLGRGAPPEPALAGRRILIVDAEDDFTAMLGQQVHSLGARVELLSHRQYRGPGDADAVILGPGPGDPLDVNDPRIATLHRITAELLADRVPFAAVCLGHQVLAATLGLSLRRKTVPSQGTARTIEFGGRRIRVGFYNTFTAVSPTDAMVCPITGGPVTVFRDRHTSEVHGLALPGARSVQFHVESILTEDGPGLLAELLAPLCAPLAAHF